MVSCNKRESFFKGKKIEGAASTILPIEDGYDAGRYYYYLGVTSREASNNDVIQTNSQLKKQPSQLHQKTKSVQKSMMVNHSHNKPFHL